VKFTIYFYSDVVGLILRKLLHPGNHMKVGGASNLEGMSISLACARLKFVLAGWGLGVRRI